jgi:hypothetical protein
VNVQFDFLCKNWNNSPNPYNLLSPRLCMQLPCCFVIWWCSCSLFSHGAALFMFHLCHTFTWKAQHYDMLELMAHELLNRSDSDTLWIQMSMRSWKYEVLCRANFTFLWDMTVHTLMFSN